MSIIAPIVGLGRALLGSALADQILSVFFGGGQGKELKAVEVDIQSLARLDVGLAKFAGQISQNVDQLWVLVTGLAASEKRGWGQAQNPIKATAVVLDQMAVDFELAIKAIVDTYVPNSIINARNYVFRTWIKDLQDALNQLVNRIAHDEVDILNLQSWRKVTVDPTLNDYRAFHAFFDTWPTTVLNAARDWIDHPDHLASFLVFHMMNALSNVMADTANAGFYDRFVALILTRTPDVSNFAQAAAVQILQGPA